jgi:hypothetical protein
MAEVPERDRAIKAGSPSSSQSRVTANYRVKSPVAPESCDSSSKGRDQAESLGSGTAGMLPLAVGAAGK